MINDDQLELRRGTFYPISIENTTVGTKQKQTSRYGRLLKSALIVVLGPVLTTDTVTQG